MNLWLYYLNRLIKPIKRIKNRSFLSVLHDIIQIKLLF